MIRHLRMQMLHAFIRDNAPPSLRLPGSAKPNERRTFIEPCVGAACPAAHSRSSEELESCDFTWILH